MVFCEREAHAASVTASLNRDTVTVGEAVTLSLVFEGVSPPTAPNLPPLNGLQFQGGISQSSQFTIVNGQASQRLNFDYTLVAQQVGEVIVPAMQMQVNGTTLVTRPLRLRVTAAAAAPAGQPEPAFVKLIVPKTNVFVGEPFPVEMQLYWQNAQNLQRPQLKADGFSVGKSAEPAQTRTQIGNAVYNVVVFRLSAAAAKSGELTLGPAETSLTILTPIPGQRSGPFDDPFGFFGPRMQGRAATLRSDPVAMSVQPLPTQDVPPTYNGAIGSFSLTVTAGPTNLTVGDPITVRAQISGQGMIEAITLPPQPDWREFNSYPPTTSVAPSDALSLSGIKYFTNIVIPLNAEIRQLPPLRFSFFDPNSRTYRTLSGPAIPLTVRPAAGVGNVPPPPTNALPRGETRAPDDILHIRVRDDVALAAGMPLVTRPWFVGLQAVPLLVWALLRFRRLRAESLARNPRLRRQREVAQRVRAGLQSLQEQAAANQSDAFFATLFRVLQEQLGERLDLPASAITEAVIDERLRGRGVSEATLTELHELFQACNMARYAPAQSSQQLAAFIPRFETVRQELQRLKV
jgi:hypothetical protein